ncbi:hypothetical protein CERSUDRAFT_125011 [Gelatoporia subvermispora B]|uniref:Uncharacterized protein n=1 Tax=Ceriporiopsis subvermispora (strain B) TaxID=914234 RepID=M2R8J6_CERS8|nr:hypothetical protein CERSUDRAFT_125011 [Gelatoporia subvermispora B]
MALSTVYIPLHSYPRRMPPIHSLYPSIHVTALNITECRQNPETPFRQRQQTWSTSLTVAAYRQSISARSAVRGDGPALGRARGELAPSRARAAGEWCEAVAARALRIPTNSKCMGAMHYTWYDQPGGPFAAGHGDGCSTLAASRAGRSTRDRGVRCPFDAGACVRARASGIGTGKHKGRSTWQDTAGWPHSPLRFRGGWNYSGDAGTSAAECPGQARCPVVQLLCSLLHTARSRTRRLWELVGGRGDTRSSKVDRNKCAPIAVLAGRLAAARQVIPAGRLESQQSGDCR